MAKQSGEKEEKPGRSIWASLKEDRYVLIMAIAVLIFIASSSLAIITSPGEAVSPVPSVTANVDGGIVSLSWAASKTPSVVSYEIYRSSEEGALGVKVGSVQPGKLSYAERVSPGTYYYTVRAVADKGDDGNTKQVTVVVANIVPSALSLSINEGGAFASSQAVTLHLLATNAKECRYKNDEDLDWTAWEPYRTQKAWSLSAGGDGERIVAYQCRNTGESDIALASVKLDRTPPLVVYFMSAVSGQVQMNIVVKDALSESVSCVVSTDGSEEQVSIQLSSGSGSYQYTKDVAPGQHTLGVRCTDDAGNSKETPAQSLSVQ